MAVEREQAETGGEAAAAIERADPGHGAVPASVTGLRSLPPQAQLRAAAGLQGVSNRALARAAAPGGLRLLAREPAALEKHASSVNTPVSGEAFVKVRATSATSTPTTSSRASWATATCSRRPPRSRAPTRTRSGA